MASFDSAQGRPLLDVRHLVKHFVRKPGLFGKPTVVKAIDDVSFVIEEGELRIAIDFDDPRDGSGSTREAYIEQKRHDAALRFQGWKVLRLSPHDVLHRPERCAALVAQARMEERDPAALSAHVAPRLVAA